MTLFTATQPEISDAQEEALRRQLSLAEQRAILNDLYGVAPPPPSTTTNNIEEEEEEEEAEEATTSTASSSSSTMSTSSSYSTTTTTTTVARTNTTRYGDQGRIIDIEEEVYMDDDDNDDDDDDAAMMDRGVRLLKEILAELIHNHYHQHHYHPYDDHPTEEDTTTQDATCAALLEAVAAIGEFAVYQETHLPAFVAYHGFNAWAATEHVLDYWSVRRKLFGADKFTLRMTLRAAMYHDEKHDDDDDDDDDDDNESASSALRALRRGILYELPADKHGRFVVFVGRIKFRGLPRHVVGRCIFFGLHALMARMADSSSSDATPGSSGIFQNGFVTLCNLQGYDLYRDYDPLLTKLIFRILTTAFPVRLQAFHAVTGWSSTVYNIERPALRYLAGRAVLLRGVVHAGSTTDIRESLATYGLTHGAHVTCFGGSNGTDEQTSSLQEWLDRQWERQA